MAVSAVLKSKPTESAIHSGVMREDRKRLADLLSSALADTYVLYLKTQNFHWNVVGPMFYGIHNLTEKQYEDMAEAIDVIAERIRSIGFVAPGSFKQFYEMSSITEETGTPPANEMIEQLMNDNENVARHLRKAVSEAERVEDVRTADLLTERIGVHEENAWMLRSLIS